MNASIFSKQREFEKIGELNVRFKNWIHEKKSVVLPNNLDFDSFIIFT